MKRLKIHIVKFLAIVISIVYLLMPIHKEVKSALHSMSHYVQMPDVIMSHNHNENQNYKFKESTLAHHEHQIIDLLDGIFDSDSNGSEDNQRESTTIEFKINKHITSNKYAFVFQNTDQIDTPVFWITNVFSQKGYLDQLYRPPKV